MKSRFLIMIAVAVSLSVARAEGPVEKAGEVAHDAVDTATNVGHSVVKGTKKAAHKVADALTPDSDARPVDVTLTGNHIDMPTSLKPGKTAFVVKNTDKQTHNFEIQGNGTDEKFVKAVGPDETRVLHVDLKRGTYTAYCPGHQKKEMDVKLNVE